MVRSARILALSLLAAASAWSGPASAAASPEGYWVDEDNSFVVEIRSCGVHFCGALVGLQPSDAMRLDVRNSDKSKRHRAWCGLSILGNLKPSEREAGKWEGGWIYNPKDGKTYSSEVRLDGPDRLKVRGYVLGPLFGKNLTLTREEAVSYRCTERRS